MDSSRGRALLFFALVASTAAPAQDEVVGPPRVVIGLGDSITRAANPSQNRVGEWPMTYAWVTGSDDAVLSHWERIALLGVTPTRYNDAVSGAVMADLNDQVLAAANHADAVGQPSPYVTILLGGNDACADTEATMTSVADYRAQLETAMATLMARLPDVRVFVASVPDLYVLWQTLHTDPLAVQTWDAGNICQSMLADATSTAQEDEDRRLRVRQRVIDYNQQLREVCEANLHCRFDDDVVFSTAFAATDVSTVDYFHPSIAGQARLAELTFGAAFDFTDVTAPVTTATFDGTLTLQATDDVGVRGIEYRRAGETAWTRYQSPLAVAETETVTFRAVDVNGNLEAAQTYPPPPDGGLPGDGGVASDAGPGTEEPDGGDTDAGDEPDGGTTGAPNTGCGCGSTGAGPVALALALAAMLRRRLRVGREE